MRRLFIGLLIIIPTLAFGQDIRRDSSGDWTLFNAGGGCIGGSSCKERRLRVPLEDRPVIAVRFHAHDQVGEKAEGVIRVKIDGSTVRGSIDIPRRGETFTIEVDELRGRYLVFEPVNDDEVQISEIAVLYGGKVMTGRIDRRDDRRDDRGPRGGWRPYPGAKGCIGGDDCGRNGDRITVALDDAPVLGVRFYAHDAIGQRADGRLRVRIDDTTINSYIDVQRAGKRHEFDVENVYGSRLVIETATDDEVDIKDVEVLYGSRRSGGPRGGGREVTHEGGCIGGDDCGGNRARIRIPIYGRAVNSIRFYARDDIGTRAGGELRIRIDDEIIEYALDIPREGRTFTVDGKGLEGDYIFIEPAEDDEVDVKDVRVRFEED
ncbi:MAG TPA: hypothetical protein VGQ36_12690 [Thermoanaerobaculia bacterium]|jgi:hypothetical protein|nr:hypothetical protein [Thermoanaerobaculia bacterium]